MSFRYTFLYFPIYPEGVRLAKAGCKDCNREECLEGVYFDVSPAWEAVCIEALVRGAQTVNIPLYLVGRLRASVAETYSDWPKPRQDEHVSAAIQTLARTPPVPWVQANNWAICHGDFCAYLGEWGQSRLNQGSQSGNGKEYLRSIIEQPELIHDFDSLWEDIDSGWAVIYVFECLTCQRRIGVDQSY